MKTLTIEWRHLDKEGATCVRCLDTGRTLAEVVKDLSREWERSGIRIVFMDNVAEGGGYPAIESDSLQREIP